MKCFECGDVSPSCLLKEQFVGSNTGEQLAVAHVQISMEWGRPKQALCTLIH